MINVVVDEDGRVVSFGPWDDSFSVAPGFVMLKVDCDLEDYRHFFEMRKRACNYGPVYATDDGMPTTEARAISDES